MRFFRLLHRDAHVLKFSHLQVQSELSQTDHPLYHYPHQQISRVLTHKYLFVTVSLFLRDKSLIRPRLDSCTLTQVYIYEIINASHREKVCIRECVESKTK